MKILHQEVFHYEKLYRFILTSIKDLTISRYVERQINDEPIIYGIHGYQRKEISVNQLDLKIITSLIPCRYIKRNL